MGGEDDDGRGGDEGDEDDDGTDGDSSDGLIQKARGSPCHSNSQ